MRFILGAGFVLAAILAVPSLLTAQPRMTAQTTIQNLQRANSTSISGRIVRIYDEDFILDDGTGQILVEADDSPLWQANLAEGEQVTVIGTYDDDNSFDAIRLTRENGDVVQIFDD
ncbi:NirD/YgiW/YdeI family stress tolerance protein [Leptolyngbya sp. 7M]|uniref:NirD/YgiW/YdeI family stress tolerance protein n=1 Tax=Leptolyngbya sp. 7M TaxID=2812896 RepID=UPI001B8D6894|nr:NirD/YgiW/YdeI family stress tolerance protein [Leptolyngbya sp. 7M]QYO63416.1 NirD/YgiW/YdeI family stress tolerance protein [Leptolyngbya sp. 7M]